MIAGYCSLALLLQFYLGGSQGNRHSIVDLLQSPEFLPAEAAANGSEVSLPAGAPRAYLDGGACFDSGVAQYIRFSARSPVAASHGLRFLVLEPEGSGWRKSSSSPRIVTHHAGVVVVTVAQYGLAFKAGSCIGFEVAGDASVLLAAGPPGRKENSWRRLQAREESLQEVRWGSEAEAEAEAAPDFHVAVLAGDASAVPDVMSQEEDSEQLLVWDSDWPLRARWELFMGPKSPAHMSAQALLQSESTDSRPTTWIGQHLLRFTTIAASFVTYGEESPEGATLGEFAVQGLPDVTDFLLDFGLVEAIFTGWSRSLLGVLDVLSAQACARTACRQDSEGAKLRRALERGQLFLEPEDDDLKIWHRLAAEVEAKMEEHLLEGSVEFRDGTLLLLAWLRPFRDGTAVGREQILQQVLALHRKIVPGRSFITAWPYFYLLRAFAEILETWGGNSATARPTGAVCRAEDREELFHPLQSDMVLQSSLCRITTATAELRDMPGFPGGTPIPVRAAAIGASVGHGLFPCLGTREIELAAVIFVDNADHHVVLARRAYRLQQLRGYKESWKHFDYHMPNLDWSTTWHFHCIFGMAGTEYTVRGASHARRETQVVEGELRAAFVKVFCQVPSGVDFADGQARLRLEFAWAPEMDPSRRKKEPKPGSTAEELAMVQFDPSADTESMRWDRVVGPDRLRLSLGFEVCEGWARWQFLAGCTKPKYQMQELNAWTRYPGMIDNWLHHHLALFDHFTIYDTDGSVGLLPAYADLAPNISYFPMFQSLFGPQVDEVVHQLSNPMSLSASAFLEEVAVNHCVMRSKGQARWLAYLQSMDTFLWVDVDSLTAMRAQVRQQLADKDPLQMQLVAREVRYGGASQQNETCLQAVFQHSNRAHAKKVTFTLDDNEPVTSSLISPRRLDFQFLFSAKPAYWPRMQTEVADVDCISINHYTDMFYLRSYEPDLQTKNLDENLAYDPSSLWMCSEASELGAKGAADSGQPLRGITEFDCHEGPGAEFLQLVQRSAEDGYYYDAALANAAVAFTKMWQNRWGTDYKEHAHHLLFKDPPADEQDLMCYFGLVNALAIQAHHMWMQYEFAESKVFLHTAASMLHFDRYDFIASSVWPWTSYEILKNLKLPEDGTTFFITPPPAGQRAGIQPPASDAPFFTEMPEPPASWKPTRRLQLFALDTHSSVSANLKHVLSSILSEHGFHFEYQSLDPRCKNTGDPLRRELCRSGDLDLRAAIHELLPVDPDDENAVTSFHEDFDTVSSRFYETLRDHVRHIDLFMCSVPALWCLLYEQFEKPVLGLFPLITTMWVPTGMRRQILARFVALDARSDVLLAFTPQSIHGTHFWQSSTPGRPQVTDSLSPASVVFIEGTASSVVPKTASS
ncbi:unnamed protein product [Polarella glacialis]|uniref:Protein xylosyltransferase n=1 Tax=Polarella glacialis TaxID=89957 RepID=A0A813HPL3_POLGL|nr:unnamed protein product [Polarella glacialis]CAE8700059.1 unnamed protein product [Polarella glacialis]